MYFVYSVQLNYLSVCPVNRVDSVKFLWQPIVGSVYLKMVYNSKQASIETVTTLFVHYEN